MTWHDGTYMTSCHFYVVQYLVWVGTAAACVDLNMDVDMDVGMDVGMGMDMDMDVG